MPPAEQTRIPGELSLPEPLPEPRDWYFTFGSGHRIYAGNSESARPPSGAGVPVDGYYVVIHGDFHSARARMYELFGAAWSSQYAEMPVFPGDMPRELIRIPPEAG